MKQPWRCNLWKQNRGYVMKLKKVLLVGTLLLDSFLICNKSYAVEASPVWWNFFQDPVSAAVGFLAREWNRHTETIHYDIKNGMEKIKENIGMYRDQGKCGISATGETGCDLSTPEQGAEEDAMMDEEAAVIPDSTIAIIVESEKDGKIVLDGKKDEESKSDKDNVVGKKGDKFDRVRENVKSYIFISDDEAVNADCTCSKGSGASCDASECAQQRQNDALYQSSLGASSVADANLRKMDERYENLVTAVSEINEAETIADFVGKMGRLSVYASDAVANMMTLQTHDLRSQSYRNLMFGNINPVDLSKLGKGDEK